VSQSYQHLIGEIPFLASLPRDKAITLLESWEKLRLEPGQVFLREGDAGTELYIVLTGEVEIVKALGTEQERLLATRSTGAVIGEMSLLNPEEVRSASARTRTAAEILVLTKEDFERLLARYPRLSLNLLRSLSNRLRRADETTIRDLRRINRQLEEAYAELKAAQQQLIEQEVIAHDLRRAAEIQQQMLPRTLPQFPGVELAALMIPARQIGGDFYDVIPLEGERLAFVVGDVAGKGISAALYMALVCTLVRAAARTQATPEDVLRTVNQELDAREMDGMFVTVLYGELDLATGRLVYVRAGHDSPLIWDRAGTVLTPPQERGIALGLMLAPPLDVQSVTLAPGNTVMITTDGVTEAMNESHSLFGRPEVEALALAHHALPPAALCQAIVQQIKAHQGAMPQSDDITVLALRLI
jgi:sigma-B regulation protein RsbU (phosphoserine phosphatase)